MSTNEEEIKRMIKEVENLPWAKRYKELFGDIFKNGQTSVFYRDKEYTSYKKVYSTWPMLEKKLGKKKPSEYQIVSYALSYWTDPLSPNFVYNKGPFELGTDHVTQKWYKHFLFNSPFVKPLFERRQWHDYEDPYKLVYWTYNAMADDNETFLDKVYEEIVRSKYDWNLSEDVLNVYKDVYDPLRYIWHVFQMESGYLATMAPTSSIVNTFIFMSMDHMRRVQRVAQRIKMLDIVYPNYGFGKETRKTWEESEIFQPAREVLEKMLVAYDWGEALASFGLNVKFTLEELLLVHLPNQLAKMGDDMQLHISRSFYNDAIRHRNQIAEIYKYAFQREPSLKNVVKEWVNKWYPESYKALEGFKQIFGEQYDKVVNEIRKEHNKYLEGIGVEYQG